MSSHAIELSDFRDGVDRKTLMTVRDRFMAVNRGRLERWEAGVGERQRLFLQLLPLLLHINHPMLPGYVSGQCPATLHGYEPDERTLHEARMLARSFQYNSRMRVADVHSLFLMGSCGTIAQTSGSDLDLWVCVRDDLGEEPRQLLQRKLDRISQWALTLDVEAHFFIMSAEAFRRGERAGLTTEDCGSTQHVLLLDEFYRSSLLVAGCYPVWWLVPAEMEQEFDGLATVLRQRRYIRGEDTIDFGSVADIPAGEFVGSGLWQLYKGIDAPYKAVLKILLTEVYASEFPKVNCVSLDFKRAIYRGSVTLNAVDPYVLLYRKVESYLLGLGEPERLELARECFYFKVDEPLSRKQPRVPWKRELLESLVAEWGWDATRINRLDAREQWKIRPVLATHQKLVGELTHSYRILSSFARNEVGQNSSARHREDMALLGRRLHAAFERKAGKLERVNPNISGSLAEPSLTLVRKINADGRELWGLYAGRAGEPVSGDALRLAGSALEILSWAYFNGLAGVSTQLNVVSGGAVTRADLQEVLAALSSAFPERFQSAESSFLSELAQPRKIILFVNFGVDAAGMLAKRGLTRISQQNNALAYGGVQEDLVLSIDVVSVNTWQEVMVTRFAQGQPLLAAARYILQQMPANTEGAMPEVDAMSFASGLAGSLVVRVREVIDEVMHCFCRDHDDKARFVIQSGSGSYVLSMDNWQMRLVRCPDMMALYECLGRPLNTFSPLVIDKRSLPGSPLHVMTTVEQPGSIRVFYRAMDDVRTEVWVQDENNAMHHGVMEVRDLELMVPMRRFLRSVLERRKTAMALGAATPLDDPEILWYEIRPGKGLYQLLARSIPAGYQDRKFLHVQALAFFGEGGIRFSLVCEGKEFSADVYGEGLYDEVADYIAARRGNGEDYPVYVTDIDLTALQQDQQPSGTITYLHYKALLEERLTRALRRPKTSAVSDAGC